MEATVEVNVIDLYLLESRSIVAKVNGYPIDNQNGYKIIAGEENATQFKIASVPEKYEYYTLTVEMVNSRGYGIEETEIKDKTFSLPVGMAVAGYGQILIRAKKTVDGTEIVVPFNLIRVKVSNTISTWEENISPGAVENAKKYADQASTSATAASASAAEAGEYSAGAWRANDSAKTWAEQAGASAAAAEKSKENAASAAGAAAGDAARSQEARSEAERIIETAKMEFRYDEINEELTLTAYKQSIYKHVFQFVIEDDPANIQVYADVYMVFFTNRSTAYTWEEAKALMMKYVGENPSMPVSAENCPVDVFYEDDAGSGITMQVAGNARIHIANTEGMAEFLVTYPKINSEGTVEALAEVPMLLKDDESYYVDTFGEMVV